MKLALVFVVVLASTLFAGCAGSGRHPTEKFVIHQGQDVNTVQRRTNEMSGEGWTVQSSPTGEGRSKYVVPTREKPR